MKEKIFYLVGGCLVIIVAIITISNTDFSSIFDVNASSSSSGSMPIDMTTAPKSVKATISELESHRSHLSETCIYGAAMMLNDLGDDAQQVINDESKCIHALVMSIIRDRKLKIRAKRQAQLKIDEEKLIASESKSMPSEQN